MSLEGVNPKIDFRENRYVRTVSNKITHLAVFEAFVFRVYLQIHLCYKKLFYIYLHPCLKSFQMKKQSFKSGPKSADIYEKTVLPEKSRLFEKIRHFEKLKKN